MLEEDFSQTCNPKVVLMIGLSLCYNKAISYNLQTHHKESFIDSFFLKDVVALSTKKQALPYLCSF